ncbi:MAG: hypothetical protein JNJ69_02030 [Leptospiraceae bacterium]|nr:hypothetical protein [Leptospiraceae bacterium]
MPRFVLSAGLVACCALFAADYPALEAPPQLNPLPRDVLAFPEFTTNYRQRILAGDYEIWSEEKLRRWVSAQGLSVTQDHPGAGLIYHRAAVIASPGITFELVRPVTEKGSEYANGWILNLDLAAIRGRDGKALPAGRDSYNNLLDCEVLLDDIPVRRILQGGRASSESPVKIQIPHIRSNEGRLKVELRLANHPRNFLFLYDAYLSR